MLEQKTGPGKLAGHTIQDVELDQCPLQKARTALAGYADYGVVEPLLLSIPRCGALYLTAHHHHPFQPRDHKPECGGLVHCHHRTYRFHFLRPHLRPPDQSDFHVAVELNHAAESGPPRNSLDMNFE